MWCDRKSTFPLDNLQLHCPGSHRCDDLLPLVCCCLNHVALSCCFCMWKWPSAFPSLGCYSHVLMKQIISSNAFVKKKNKKKNRKWKCVCSCFGSGQHTAFGTGVECSEQIVIMELCSERSPSHPRCSSKCLSLEEHMLGISLCMAVTYKIIYCVGPIKSY